MGFDPASPQAERSVRDRGWKVDLEACGDEVGPVCRRLPIDHDGEVVGVGRGEEVPQAVLAAFADDLVKTG